MISFQRIIGLLCLVLSSVLCYAQDETEKPVDEAYKKHIIEESDALAYEHIREADVFWKKRVWRVIDTREKMNLAFRYPKEYFVEILRVYALEGEITVYDPIDDKFTTKLDGDEAYAQGAGKPYWEMVVNPLTGRMDSVLIEPDLDPQKVIKFRIKEDWIFDEGTSTMQVRILGVAPIVEVFGDDGVYRGEKVLFWAYYPELREVLAQHRYFNTKNDATTMTWADIFDMRYFSSYIYKESNVHDRRIQDYSTGVDAMLESDRIKQEIFEFEHDLWSY